MKWMLSIFHFLVLTVIFYTAILKKNYSEFLIDMKSVNTVNIYLKVGINNSETNQFVNEINKKYKVESLKIVEQNESLHEFQKSFGEYARNVVNLNEITDLIPQIIEVKFLNSSDKNIFLDSLKTKKSEYIDEVSDLGKWSEKIIKIKNIIEQFLNTFYLAIVLAFCVSTYLFIKFHLLTEKKNIQIKSYFGTSFNSLIKNKTKEYILMYFGVWFCSVIFSILMFMLILSRLSNHSEIYYISERLAFLSWAEVIAHSTFMLVIYLILTTLTIQFEIKKIFINHHD